VKQPYPLSILCSTRLIPLPLPSLYHTSLYSCCVPMNWTGGRLSRHSRKTGSLTARQKQHFARVQSAQQAGAKQRSPQKWTVLGHVIEENQRRKPSVEFDARHSANRAAHEPSVSCWPPDSVPMSRSRRRIVRHTSYNSDEHQEKDCVISKRQQSRTPFDDLYDATPEPPNKRRRNDRGTRVEQEKPSISETRKQLLLKGDWVGIKTQNPARYNFVPPIYGDNFGQRRKVSHKARYNSRHTAIGSPFSVRAIRDSPHDFIMRERQHKQGRTDVRISIGGRTINPGISSSPGRSRRPSSSTKAQVLESQVTSSDIMLLDQENISDLQAANHIFGHEKLASIGKYLERTHQHRRQQRQPPNCSRVSYDQDHIKFQESEQHHYPLAAEFSEIDSRCDSPLEGSKIDTSERVIFSSSSVSVHHPAPQSSKLKLFLRNLRSSSSELAHSTVAHVGRANPAVPQSQMLDHKTWEIWVNDMDGNYSSNGICEQPAMVETLISPGISEALERCGKNPSSSSLPRLGTTISQSRDDGDEVSNSIYMPSSCLVSVTGCVEPAVPLQKVQTRHEENEVYKEPRCLGNPTSKRLSKSRLDTIHGIVEPTATLSAKGKTTRLNSDELWRKFVFSGSDDEEEPSEIETKEVCTGSRLEKFSLSPSSVPASAVIDSSLFREEEAVAIQLSLPEEQKSILPYIQDKQRPNGWSSNRNLNRLSVSSSSDIVDTLMSTTANISTSSPSQVVKNDRKVLFTKPKPFIGSKVKQLQGGHSPIYIGRLARRANSLRNDTGRESHQYCSTESDDESIEDN